jgi:hypothetical protein
MLPAISAGCEASSERSGEEEATKKDSKGEKRLEKNSRILKEAPGRQLHKDSAWVDITPTQYACDEPRTQPSTVGATETSYEDGRRRLAEELQKTAKAEEGCLACMGDGSRTMGELAR